LENISTKGLKFGKDINKRCRHHLDYFLRAVFAPVIAAYDGVAFVILCKCFSVYVFVSGACDFGSASLCFPVCVSVTLSVYTSLCRFNIDMSGPVCVRVRLNVSCVHVLNVCACFGVKLISC